MTSSLLVFGAECRSCEFRWKGSAGVEALAVEVGIQFTTEAEDVALTVWEAATKEVAS